MKLTFESVLNGMYFKSLVISKREQRGKWKFFTDEVPTFSIPILRKSCIISGLLTHLFYYKMIKVNVREYRRVWSVAGEQVVKRLDGVFGFSFLGNLKAYVCITPLYTRNIEECEFLLPTNACDERLLEIIIHELSHFYFFEGCAKQGISLREAWLLSEQIVPFLIGAHFESICSNSGSYVEQPSDDAKCCIELWMKGKIGFDDFLVLMFR